MKGASKKSAIATKVCGMKAHDNILDVAEISPEYLGFIFYEKSARHFTGIIPNLPKSIVKVGVFVNETISNIIDKLEFHNLDAVQLHGSESAEYCKELRSELPTSIIIIKAFSIGTNFDFNSTLEYDKHCDYFLFDTKGKLAGGNGIVFNWELLFNYKSAKPFFLSGGIGIVDIQNITKLLHAKLPLHAVDFNSKLEDSPGFKNVELCNQAKVAVSEL